jgi:hypothetical protein
MSRPGFKPLAILTVVVLACLSVGSGLLVLDARRADSVRIVEDGNWGKALRDCWTLGGQSYDSPAGTCISAVLYQSATDGEILAAADAVTEFASENYEFYGTCHRVVHALGEKLYNYYGDIERAVGAVNSRDCGTGLAHGVVDYWTTLKPDDTEFANAVASCDKVFAERFGGCAEALGHSAYQRLDSDHPDRHVVAFNTCSLFGTSDTQWTCAYGVMMQPYFKQNPIITEKAIPVPEWSRLIGVCSEVSAPEAVVRGCYAGGGWMMGLSLIFDVVPDNRVDVPEEVFPLLLDKAREGIRVCSTVTESAAAEGCIEQVLARMPNAWYADLDQLESRCAVIREEFGGRVGDFCLSGAWEFTPPAKMTELIEKNPSLKEILKGKLTGRG